jgi:hypothetical protein
MTAPIAPIDAWCSGMMSSSLAEFQNFPESPDHSDALAATPPEKSTGFHLFPPCHGAPEIPCKGETEPCNYIVERCGHLLVMDHVTLGEDTASCRQYGEGRPTSLPFSELLFNLTPILLACWSRNEPVPAAHMLFISKSTSLG